MDNIVLCFLAYAVMATAAWSIPYYPGPREVQRYTRYAPPPPPPHYRIPIRQPIQDEPQWQRPKRDHEDYHHHDDDDHKGSSSGVTGPVHTFVKTDKNANYKWGVRHHVGNKYAS
ncbi:uncharacterized protein LOC131843711 [Achroia grisella]|uniref:uncharacterized protein LOC131843711 n=1 Tax=Achroia grisella TaxID=688607 RepID=UPI0027D234AF|nr:uncharacterized protein LOC131843711 [Achroia grisella]